MDMLDLADGHFTAYIAYLVEDVGEILEMCRRRLLRRRSLLDGASTMNAFRGDVISRDGHP